MPAWPARFQDVAEEPGKSTRFCHNWRRWKLIKPGVMGFDTQKVLAQRPAHEIYRISNLLVSRA
jgi:hypothetical protein